MHILYSMQGSGNCYKLRLALRQTKTPFRLLDVNVLQGETRTKEFLVKNPVGKVPVLELEDGRFLPESNAGLYYVAQGSNLFPDGAFDRANVIQWMFFEQFSHEPNVATARFWWSIAPGGRELKANEFENWHKLGYQALDIMEGHLTNHDFFAANTYTIADIALYAYTHVANEGGFDLSSYQAINDWLERIKQQPDHVPINWRP